MKTKARTRTRTKTKTKTKTRIIALIIAALMVAAAASCGQSGLQETGGQPNGAQQGGASGPGADGGAGGPSGNADAESPGDGGGGQPGQQAGEGAGNGTRTDITADREGNPIEIPDRIDTVISMGPSNTEILVALGLAHKIMATDTYSEGVPEIDPRISYLDMLFPDGEQIVALQPDVIFVTGMGKETTGDDPLNLVSATGICVIYIPSSKSIEGIKEDIRFIASVMGEQQKGEGIVAEMESAIDAIRAVGQTITEKKGVYFEISAAPWMYSFGTGVFLNEMIEILGATNVFADQQDWFSVADEVILATDPDVILTSVDYIDDPVDEIMARPGWGGVAAVREGAVYYIDANASNRPSHNIVIALEEMAKAVYPDLYGGN